MFEFSRSSMFSYIISHIYVIQTYIGICIMCRLLTGFFALLLGILKQYRTLACACTGNIREASGFFVFLFSLSCVIRIDNLDDFTVSCRYYIIFIYPLNKRQPVSKLLRFFITIIIIMTWTVVRLTDNSKSLYVLYSILFLRIRI